MKKLNPNQRKWLLRIGVALYLVLSVLWSFYLYSVFSISGMNWLGPNRPPEYRWLIVAAIPWVLLIIWYVFKWMRGDFKGGES